MGRQVALVVFALFLSVCFGVALVHVKPLFVYGLVLCVLFTIAVIRWPYFGLLVYLIVYVLRVGEIYPVLEPLRLERVLGVLTLVSMLLHMKLVRGHVEFDHSRQTIHLLLLQFAILLTIPTAYWRGGAITGSIDFLKILVFYFLVVQLIDTRRKFWTFFATYFALMCYLAVDSVSNYVKGSLLVAQGIERAVGGTSAGGGPNEMGATMACSIPIALLFFLDRRTPRWRMLALVMLGFMLVTLILTGSRSGLLGFLAAMSYLVWRSRHRLVFGFLAIVLAVGAFAVLPDQYKGRYNTMTSSQLDGSSSERIKVWKKGLRMVVDRPLFGVGVHCFGTANALSYSSGPRASYLQSHSLYVQVPAELGLVGAAAFFSYLWVIFGFNRRLRATLARSEDPQEWSPELLLLRGMFAGFVALLITGVFGHSLMRVTWYLYPAMALALARVYLVRSGRTGTSAVRELLG